MTRRRPGTGTRGRSGDWQPPSRGALWRATPLAAVSAVVAILLIKPLRYCAFLTFRIFFSDLEFSQVHGAQWRIPVQPFDFSILSRPARPSATRQRSEKENRTVILWNSVFGTSLRKF